MSWRFVLACNLFALAMLLAAWTVVKAQTPAPPSSAIVATNQVGILVNGIPIAAEPNVNFASGNGILVSAIDNPAMSRVDVTPNINSVFAATLDQIHTNPLFCDSVTQTQQYACKLPYKALTGYARGMIFLLAVDTTCQSGCAVNIDSNGPINLWQADGVTAASGSPIAGRAVHIWFDGKVFRLL